MGAVFWKILSSAVTQRSPTPTHRVRDVINHDCGRPPGGGEIAVGTAGSEVDPPPPNFCVSWFLKKHLRHFVANSGGDGFDIRIWMVR